MSIKRIKGIRSSKGRTGSSVKRNGKWKVRNGKYPRSGWGFTLIELLIAVSIVGILSTVLVVAVNPGRQLAKARDSERQTDLIGILSAIMQYASEHSGDLPDTDDDPETSNFPTSATCIGTGVGCFDLANAGETDYEIVPVYMVSMPEDPRTGEASDTGYTIYVDENGRLHAAAVGEIETSITVDR